DCWLVHMRNSRHHRVPAQASPSANRVTSSPACSILPARLHVHVYDRLRRLVVDIQKDRCRSVSTLARIVERTPRTVQRDLEALRYRFEAPLVFDRSRRGYRFSDPAWRFPEVKLTEGELIACFAAARILRRLGAASEAPL